MQDESLARWFIAACTQQGLRARTQRILDELTDNSIYRYLRLVLTKKTTVKDIQRRTGLSYTDVRHLTMATTGWIKLVREDVELDIKNGTDRSQVYGILNHWSDSSSERQRQEALVKSGRWVYRPE